MLTAYPAFEEASNPDLGLVDLAGMQEDVMVGPVVVDGDQVAPIASLADVLQRKGTG